MILSWEQRKAGYWECKSERIMTTEKAEIKLKGLHEL